MILPPGSINLHHELTLNQSKTIDTYVFGRNSHNTSQFCSKMGMGLVENGMVELEINLWFLFQASWTFLTNQWWWNNSSLQPHAHGVMARAASHYPISLQNGDRLCRKWQGWTRKPSIIPTSSIMNLDHEIVLTLECDNNSLQPYTCVFLSSTAPELLNVAPKWGLAWHKRARLDYKSIYDYHHKLHKSSLWTNIDFIMV